MIARPSLLLGTVNVHGVIQIKKERGTLAMSLWDSAQGGWMEGPWKVSWNEEYFGEVWKIDQKEWRDLQKNFSKLSLLA